MNEPLPSVPTRPHNAAVDWLRVGSIWYIAGFWHLFGYTSTWHAEQVEIFFRLTSIVLSLFVLISGYLLGSSRVQFTSAAIGHFYRKRLVRIYPPYLLALAVFAVAGILGSSALKAALLVSMFSPPPPFTLWFVTMIVIFYLFAPLLLTLVDRPFALIALSGATWCALFLWWIKMDSIDVRLLVYFPAFVIGLLIGRHQLRAGSITLVALTLLTGFGYWLSFRATWPADHSIWSAPVALFGSLLLFMACNGRLPNNQVVHWLAGGSFFLYLFHRPIYMLVMKLFGGNPVQEILALYIIGFPTAVIGGIAGQRLYDIAIDRLSARRTRGGVKPG